MVFSENDKYLIEENYRNGGDGCLRLVIANASFVVPFKYVENAKNVKDAIRVFEKDLFDFEIEEVKKYKKYKEQVKTIIYDDRVYVVPFVNRRDAITPKKVAERTTEKAIAKYNMIINVHRKLKKRRMKIGFCSFSSKDAKRYVELVNKANEIVFFNKASEGMIEVARFLGKVGNDGIKKFNVTASKLQKKIKKKIMRMEFREIKKFVTDNYKIGVLMVALGVGGSITHRLIDDNFNLTKKSKYRTDIQISPQNNNKKSKSKVNVLGVKDKVSDRKYVTFMGDELRDDCCNIALINSMRDDVTILMTAIEGFSDVVYDDGTGVKTTGIGLTYRVDENGNEYPITKNDRLSEQDVILNKWRFIEKNLFPVIASIDRECSKEELMTLLGAGFCWGANGLEKSKFFDSVKRGQDIKEQTRKLTGYRKPIGLLKRGYLLACVLNKKWTIDDIRDMPVYYIENKGYVGCSIYNIDFSDILPCVKDAKGNFIKDEYGHKVPQIDSDGYCCYYLDRSGAVLNKINHMTMMGDEAIFIKAGELLSVESYEQLKDDIALSDMHRDILNSSNNKNGENVLKIDIFLRERV